MTNAVQHPQTEAVVDPSIPARVEPKSHMLILNLPPISTPFTGLLRHDPYIQTTPRLSDISQLNPDAPLPMSLSMLIITPILIYLIYLRLTTRQMLRQQKRDHQTELHTQREQHESEAAILHQQFQQYAEHINRLRTEQILREKQTIQLRNRLEQREKLLDRFTAELLPAAINTVELSTTAKSLQQACRTAELSARFDNKLLQRLPPSFERALTQLYPRLSDEDIRLAGYLFLDLPNKEIAQLRSISAAGVSKSRNRLRKKLKLNPEQDLTVFMRSLTDGHPHQDLDQLALHISQNHHASHNHHATQNELPHQHKSAA
jgi:DNA-binding CsgD family transcriptional regulator